MSDKSWNEGMGSPAGSATAEEGLDIGALMSAVTASSSTPMMMIDRDFKIVWANQATLDLLGKHEEALRKVFRGFDAKNVLGANIDMFHANPAHQRRLLADPRNLPHRADIKVGALTFDINVTAVHDDSGTYVASALEWHDVTTLRAKERDVSQQKSAERAIEALISSASEGRLEERIAVDELTGFMKNIAGGVNRLLDTVVTPLREIGRVIDALADGSLTQRMDGDFSGEFDSLKQSLNTSMDRLLEVVTRISDSAGSVKSAAGEIASGNTHLKQRTEEQAQSLQETASSIEELTATVKQNADNARQANQLAASARENAEKGGDVVGRAVTSMSAINEASKKIADIIGVIDEIAFQTNLLALNAAVEAARAGEQGRGFAVVATEVRNLAQRSAEAAKQIKALINDSVEKVDQGTRLVDESGSTLKDIVQSVKRVSDIVAEISAASDEQASGIEQINKAVVQMDEVTQQNAAQVEQVAAAAESLQQQAEDLDGMVGTFDVGHSSDSGAGKGSAQADAEHVRRPAASKAPAPAARKPAPAPARVAPKPAARTSSPVQSKAPSPAPRRPSPSKGEGDDWKEF